MATATQSPAQAARRLRIGPRDYTPADLHAIGRQHGEAGRAAFPPHLWVSAGESVDIAEAIREYLAGYAAGCELRMAWARLWAARNRDARRGERRA